MVVVDSDEEIKNLSKKMRFCCDNAYSLTTRIMSNETGIFILNYLAIFLTRTWIDWLNFKSWFGLKSSIICPCSWDFIIRGDVKKKKNSIFKDIAQIGGGGGQPHVKNLKRTEFLTKVGEGGGHKIYCQKLKHSILYDL